MIRVSDRGGLDCSDVPHAKPIGTTPFEAAQSSRWVIAMLVVVAFVAALATLGFSASTFRSYGYVWAENVCGTASILCSSPHFFALAAIGLLIFYLVRNGLRGAA